MSLRQIGARFGRGPDWARARLAAAGVSARTPREAALSRGVEVDPDRLRAWVAEGLTLAQIAALAGCSAWTVSARLREHGIPSPARGHAPSLQVLDAGVLLDLYVVQRRTIAGIADALGISTDRVRKGLAAGGIEARRPGGTRTGDPMPASISRAQLDELYVRAGLSCAQVAARLGGSPTRVAAALRREGIGTRPRNPPAPVFECDERTLRRLYVHERLDDVAIGRRYGVPTWRVTVRRRQLKVARPACPPPHPTSISPGRAVLRRLYVEEGRTLEQIARAHRTSSRVVHDWLVAAGIAVAERTSRAHRKSLDLGQLRELYVRRGWTAELIAVELDTTVQLVLRTLHEQGVPVRRPGPQSGGRRPAVDRLLDDLYGDADVTGFLRRWGIPRREQTGPVASRFPTPVELSEPLLRDAYLDVGLSARQIEVLTGQPSEQILDALHAMGIPVRGSGLSPWLRAYRGLSKTRRGGR